MYFQRRIKNYLIVVLIVGVWCCEKKAPIIPGQNLSDWSDASHSGSAAPNYDIVFDQDQVLRLDIVIEPEYWQAMQDDLESLVNIQEPPLPKSTEIDHPWNMEGNKPVYIPCQLYFNGKQWYDVGIRYKGNSSLRTAVRQGIKKLPFRLEINHFEDENPNISGQTFYGFRQLSLANNFKDISFIHEKVATDIYREFGVPAPMSAFYRVYIDYGDGPVYFGLYTMVEVVFDGAMLQTQFGSNSGNCYKPEGTGAQLNNSNLVNSVFFPNKTNPEASLEDVKSMVGTLLSGVREHNPADWRGQLESVFHVDLFLKWLAANTTMQNWDTYGEMNHNYYLYNNPLNGLLTWIPWDNNEAFSDKGGPQTQGSGVLEFDFSNLSAKPLGADSTPAWPLIAYLYNDTVYRAKYQQYISEFIHGVFLADAMTERFTKAHNLVKPYVIGIDGEASGYTFLTDPEEFEHSLDELINFIEQRRAGAEDYLP